ncbi:MAG: hypothetical protein GF364_21965 [Candidatus Lokiarchaeota archaeon]|nr:hypothetical protein [Candidatus Lokiarchaeota archaeon]
MIAKPTIAPNASFFTEYPFAAHANITSWVLSPSSARNTSPKDVKSALINAIILFAADGDLISSKL